MALLLRDHLGYSVQLLDLPLNYLQSSHPLLTAYSSLYSMSNYGLTTVEAVGLTMPENLNNDPVTKAVYDNIMGNIPKKPKVSVFCNVCNLEFSSQTVLDTHMAGSKHQRKLKSKELMKSLEETESGFEKNSVSGVIRCTVCDITVNSPQLLATHVAGNKHKAKKGKRENGEDGGTPAKKVCGGATDQSNGEGGKTASGKTTSSEVSPPKKKERAPLAINIPACVTKLEDTKTGGKFLCNPCQAHCNSDVQLSQHLSSKKHLEKVSGKKKAPTSARGGGRGWKGGLFGRGRGGATSSRGSGLSGSSKWNSLSTSSALFGSSLPSSYSQSASFPESSSSLSSSYGDSYGLSSLGRSSTSDYSYSSRPSSSSRGGGRGSSSAYGRGDVYSRSEGGGYARATSAASTAAYRTDLYSRADYGAEYPSTPRADELTSYSRAATEYAAHGYGAEYAHGYGGSSTMTHATGRGMPFTYTQPLSQNFVSGGSIL